MSTPDPASQTPPDGRGLRRAPMAGKHAGWGDADQGWHMIGSFVSGPLAWGGFGWLLDGWLGTDPWFMTAGVVLGFVLGFYLVIMRAGGFNPQRAPRPSEIAAARAAEASASPTDAS